MAEHCGVSITKWKCIMGYHFKYKGIMGYFVIQGTRIIVGLHLSAEGLEMDVVTIT